MFEATVKCRANRGLRIGVVPKGIEAKEITVFFADDIKPITPEGSDARPGFIGHINWQDAWVIKDRVFTSVVERTEQCARCVGLPNRGCDISTSNEDNRIPQT